MSTAIEQRPLGRSGLSLPVLGIGCSPFGDRARRLPATACDDTIAAALQAGANYFDTAPYYGFGLCERRVGDALRAQREAGRSFVLSSKVGRLLEPDDTIDTRAPRNGFYSAMPFRPRFDYSYDGVMRSYEASLQRLGLARIDMLFVHDIGAFAHGDDHADRLRELMGGGMRALTELRDAGAVAAIGLGVNEIAVCEEIMAEVRLDCLMLAGRYTLLEQGGLDAFLPRCSADDIAIIIGGPYNSGLLAGGTRRSGALRYDYGEAPAAIIEKLQAIERICDAHAVPIAAAALQFPLAHPAIASVVPGVGSAARIAETIALLDHPTPADFWAELAAAGLIAAEAPLPGDRTTFTTVD